MAPRKKEAVAEVVDGDGDQAASVRAVFVAAQILDGVAEHREAVRLSDLARQLNMSLSRISRHVATLRTLGYLEKAETSEAYRLGTKLFQLGQIALSQGPLANVAYGYLRRLRDLLGQTVVLATPVAGGARVVMCLESTGDTALVVRPGTFMSFPKSPSARLFHAFGDPAPVVEGPSGAATSDPGLQAKLADCRQNRFDSAIDVYGDGIGSIAAGVFDHEDRIIGAVIVMAVSSMLRGADYDRFQEAAIACASKLSSTLGSKAWAGRPVGAG
jgi:DNA-binding IclR family transcriptional regulator